MKPTISPWLAQLSDRPAYTCDGNLQADVTIVGAGISGVSTALQLLLHSDRSVLMIDAGHVAHGASGRNAGHVVNEFERPLEDIIKAFGPDMTYHSIREIETAWDILQELLNMTGLEETYEDCRGFNGCTTVEDLIDLLETHAIRKAAGLEDELMAVAAIPSVIAQIPEHLQQFIIQAPHSRILDILDTDDTAFIAAELADIGCMNSALFCEHAVKWMLERYPERFRIAEKRPAETVHLHSTGATITTEKGTITTKNVVLCTNGYEHIHIKDDTDAAADERFHKMVVGVVGFMTGFTASQQYPSISALCYYNPEEYYMTRRPYPKKDGTPQTLFCMGGIDTAHPEDHRFDHTTDIPPEVMDTLNHQICNTYTGLPADAKHEFLWKGLMGHTENRLRRVGFDPKNAVLLYNLGCNGVGILQAVYGSKRIRQLLNGEKLAPTIFDPDKGHL